MLLLNNCVPLLYETNGGTQTDSVTPPLTNKPFNKTYTFKPNKIMRFDKHTNTLQRDGDDIISYRTRVATIIGDKLHVHGKYSPCTSRHINYVVDELNLTKVNSSEYFDNYKVDEEDRNFDKLDSWKEI